MICKEIHLGACSATRPRVVGLSGSPKGAWVLLQATPPAALFRVQPASHGAVYWANPLEARWAIPLKFSEVKTQAHLLS